MKIIKAIYLHQKIHTMLARIIAADALTLMIRAVIHTSLAPSDLNILIDKVFSGVVLFLLILDFTYIFWVILNPKKDLQKEITISQEEFEEIKSIALRSKNEMNNESRSPTKIKLQIKSNNSEQLPEYSRADWLEPDEANKLGYQKLELNKRTLYKVNDYLAIREIGDSEFKVDILDNLQSKHRLTGALSNTLRIIFYQLMLTTLTEIPLLVLLALFAYEIIFMSSVISMTVKMSYLKDWILFTQKIILSISFTLFVLTSAVIRLFIEKKDFEKEYVSVPGSLQYFGVLILTLSVFTTVFGSFSRVILNYLSLRQTPKHKLPVFIRRVWSLRIGLGQSSFRNRGDSESFAPIMFNSQISRTERIGPQNVVLQSPTRPKRMTTNAKKALKLNVRRNDYNQQTRTRNEVSKV